MLTCLGLSVPKRARRYLLVPFLCLITLLTGSAKGPKGELPNGTVATSHSESTANSALKQGGFKRLSLDTSPLFGLSGVFDLNQAGDYAFIGNGSSALFFRPSGGAVRRVTQIGEAIPSVASSRTDLISSFKMNSTGRIVFLSQFNTPQGFSQAALLSYDGTNTQKIVSAGDIAPSTGGAIYGRLINLAGLNNAGDVAFTASLLPLGSLITAIPQTTLFIVPNGGAAQRIVGPGDVAPGTGGGTFNGITLGGTNSWLNNSGEVLFRAQIVGGSGGVGLFAASTGGVRKIVAHGDPIPGGGTFSFPVTPPTAFLNNAGQCLFTNGTFFIHTPATGIAKAVASGDSAPAAVGGTLTLQSLFAFNDAGSLVFTANVTGGVTPRGIFRFIPGTGIETVATANQSAAGAGAAVFNTFVGGSINQSGQVSFVASMTGGSAVRGIYTQSGVANPVNVALEGQASPVAGGGNYFLANIGFTRTLDNGATYFPSDLISGAAADYAEFVGTTGSLTTLMNNGEALPAGSQLTLRNFSVQSSGDWVAFSAQQAGGKFSIVVRNVVTNVTTTIGMAGDIAPGTGGARFRATGGFFINSNGSVVFNASTVGGTQFLAQGVFLWTTAGGIVKVVHHGDIDPNSGSPFTVPSIGTLNPSPINNSDQVAFRATVLSRQGIYRATPGNPIERVIQNADAAPGGGTFNTFNNTYALNQSGQVAFVATTTGGPGSNQGVFVGTPGSGVAKVAVSGDAVPGGGTFFSFPNSVSFNDSSEVAFIASLGPAGATGVACAGTTTGPLEVLARDGGNTPAGGTYVIPGLAYEMLINNQHDVVFRSAISGGISDSAFFMRRGATGPLQWILRQGQQAPGTTGVFTTVPTSPNNLIAEQFALGPTGEVAFSTSFTSGTGATFGVFRYRTDSLLEKVIARGEVVPGTGGGQLLVTSQAVGTGGPGRFAFWEWIFGGNVDDTIFVTSSPAGSRISGQIKDVDGLPLQGISVILGGSVSGLTTTDASGNYSFNNLGNGGNYTVSASNANFAFSPLNFAFNNLTSDRVANFVGTRTIVSITGNVVDGSNAPMNNVTMSLTTNGNPSGTIQTNALGDYIFPNLAAGQNYVVTPTGSFRPSSQTFANLTNNGFANFVASPNVAPQCNTFSFGSPTGFAPGTSPLSLVSGDFNADGKLDLALPNQLSNTVSIFLGNGTGGFGPGTSFPAGTRPVEIVRADFNEDGKLDLAVANENGNSMSVLLGTGTGSFGAPTTFPVGTFAFAIDSGDLNNDNNLDIVVANANSSNVSVLLGNGAGNFAAAVNVNVGSSPQDVLISDLNGDGRLDLVVGRSLGFATVLLGTGTGTFGSPTDFSMGTLVLSKIALGDFNTDGKVDVASANFGSNDVSIALGTGTGAFGVATTLNAGTNPNSITAQDVNGDGKVDLLVPNFNSANLSIFLGTGSGTFTTAMNVATGTNPRFVATGDFNGDGKTDLAAAATNGSNLAAILLNTSSTCNSQSSLTISGQVKSPFNSPIPDVAVTLSGPITRVVASDVNGNYAIPNLAPGGNYVVTIQSSAYVFGPSRADLFNLSTNQVVNFTAAPNVVPLPTPTPSDNFTTPNRDPERWNLGTQTQPVGAVDPLVTTTQVNGQLVITPVSQAVGLHYNGYVSASSFDMRHGVASVELVQAASGGADSIFAIGSDRDNFTRFVVHTAGGPSGTVNLVRGLDGKEQPLDTTTPQLIFQVNLGGQLTSIAIAYDPVAHRHLRFRHTIVNDIVFETSPNNVDFVERHRVTLQKSVSALTAELSAGTPNPTNPGQTIFDNFTLVTSTYQFSAGTYTVNEGGGSIEITVTRSQGPLSSGTSSVEYTTMDGTAQQRTRYIPAVGTLTFAPGQLSRTFRVLVVDNVLTEGNQTVNLLLGNPQGSGLNTPGRAVLTIEDNDTLVAVGNPVDEATFFAQQHYLDFLNRQPDAAGLAFWANEIAACGTDQQCKDVKRVNVSAAFFLSIEFQETGYLVERMYKAAYGDATGTSVLNGAHQLPVPIIRREEFLPDTQEISQGVVVGVPGWDQLLEQNKQTFATGFVQRNRFKTAFPNTLTAEQFVTTLNTNAGNVLSAGERASLITLLGATPADAAKRAQVLRAVAEDADLKAAEFNRAFVLMQYYGYLRRNPNDPQDTDYTGYEFWLQKLDQFGGNFVNAEMVKAFILSIEYRNRFAP